jgi:hypothetical protein
MSRARDLSKLSSPSNFTVDANNNIGVNSTSPDAKLDVIGIVSATSFFGDGSGLTSLSGSNISSGTVAAARVATLNQNTTGTSGGLTGTPDIVVRNITGVAATFTGVLTYEDVTNIDSLGIVTARTGIKVLAGGIDAVGVVTATSFVGSGASLTNLPASGDSNDITACLFI